MRARTTMKITSFATVAATLFFTFLPMTTWAANPPSAEPAMATTVIAGHSIPVVAGGLYDRFHSNPPLSVIAQEAPDVDLSWFKGLTKTRMDIGFESFSPNFYYKNNKVTVVYTADLDTLRSLMPANVLEQVQPLQVWPGRGLVALTAYAYEYCDNDSYNELSLSIVTNKPGSSNLGPISLAGQAMAKDLWGYVLKLPVNTELARVRGVVGYNLPKWLTPINRSETDKWVKFEIIDNETGNVDMTLETEKLADLSTDEERVTNSFTNTGHDNTLTHGYAVSRHLSHASSTDASSVKLQLSDGSLSTYIKALGLGKMMRYEYVPAFQSALYAPTALQAFLNNQNGSNP